MENLDQTPPPAPVRSGALGSGAGWRWDEKTKTLHLLFEVQGMAHDDSGKPCPCGLRYAIGPCAKTPTAEECEARVKLMEQTGLCLTYNSAPKPCKGITWEKFVAEGYDEQ